jgi:hypothetical protein
MQDWCDFMAECQRLPGLPRQVFDEVVALEREDDEGREEDD